MHEIRDYATYHAKRFAFLLATVQRCADHNGVSILEIGRGPFTSVLRRAFPRVTTMGLALDGDALAETAGTDPVPHIVYDLRNVEDPATWPRTPGFDVVVFAEVLEHLYVSAEHTFRFLASLLAEGGRLVIQTPNGVNLVNRVKMLMGVNPIAPYALNPDFLMHYREYTKAELLDLAARAGLVTESHAFASYFGWQNPLTRVADLIAALVPPFRRGQTAVFRKPKAGSR